MKRERDNIKEQYDEINKAHNKLYIESKYLQYGIEKKQHQLDKITMETNKGDPGI
jgi:predicted nuclease with TOPRIM domain